MNFRKYFAFVIAGLFALSLVLLVVRLTSKPAKGAKGPSDICSHCGQKLRYEGASCSYCKYLEVLRSNGQNVPAPHASSPATKLAIIASVLGLMTVGVYWTQLRRLWRGLRQPRESYLVLRCQSCRRKLRYAASSSGKQGLCPGCGKVCEFPTVAAAS